VQQIQEFGEDLPATIERLRDHKLVGGFVEKYELQDKIADIDGATALSAAGQVFGGITVLLSSIANVLVTIILTLYFLAAFERLKEGAYRLFPASRRERARLLGDEILARIGRYVSGALVIAGIAGACSFAFMEIAGVPYPFALALVVAFTDLIPQIGATLGAVVVCIVAFTVSVPVGIAAVIFFIAYQQLENWLIYPRVMKKAVNVSDLAAIVSTLIGAALLGVVGVLIAVPACAAIQLIVREIVVPRQDIS
jgi:predicted PurR-regulated permease PerM